MRIPRTPPPDNQITERFSDVLEIGLSDPDYARLMQEALRSHRHYDNLRFIAADTSRDREKPIDPDLLWAMVKMTRRWQYRELPLKGTGGEQVKYLVTDAIQRELSEIDRELSGPLLSSEEHPLDPSQRERFIVNAFREEAIASSMLEGAATTRREAKQMLRSGRTPRTKGERMVVNNYNAIEFIREQRSASLSLEFLLELQRILTEGTQEYPLESGRLRGPNDDIVVQDQYGQVLHTPPPAHELEARVKALCDFANAADASEQFVHPIIKASALHFQIGVDHPFCDGNGRTARAVFYWYMLRSGYWLFEYLPISRLIYRGPAKYVRAFLYSETDEYDLTYFLVYSAEILRRARQELHEYLRTKQQEMSRARAVFRTDQSLNHRQRQVVLEAVRDPDFITTIAAHQGEFRVSYGTAHSDLDALAKMQYLSRQRSGNRHDFVRGPRLSELEGELGRDG